MFNLSARQIVVSATTSSHSRLSHPIVPLLLIVVANNSLLSQLSDNPRLFYRHNFPVGKRRADRSDQENNKRSGEKRGGYVRFHSSGCNATSRGNINSREGRKARLITNENFPLLQHDVSTGRGGKGMRRRYFTILESLLFRHGVVEKKKKNEERFVSSLASDRTRRASK